MIVSLTHFAESNTREIYEGDTWVSVHDPRATTPNQGWKLHVSARPGTLGDTLERVLPVLADVSCDFKVACSPEKLAELNSGDLDPGAVGKAITVYPRPDEVVPLGHRLAEALAGLAAPRIVSDRQVRRGAPVYYRYAPFAPQYRVDENGDFELIIVSPDGEHLPGAAGPEFSCPPWATDPFRPQSGVPDSPQDPPRDSLRDSPREGATGPDAGEAPARLIGNRYRVTSGVARGPRGNVYRAEDADGRPVVVKEARAYVGENAEGWDLRMYLRNDLRILKALDGVPGIPTPIDHFRHGEDEFLVMTDAGSLDLNRFVGERGRFTENGSDRDLTALAGRLLEVLDAVHARGVVVRDFSPKNVVLGDDGRCTLIDFGNSRYEGLQLPGWSRGYSVPGQQADRPSEPADDYFSLGATLFFSATGMNPIMIDPDPAKNVERTLMCLARMFPGATTGVVGLLPRLLSLDAEERVAAAADMRADVSACFSADARSDIGADAETNLRSDAGADAEADARSDAGADVNADAGAGRAGRTASRSDGVRFSGALLSQVLDHTTRVCVRFAEGLMDGPADARTSSPPVTNVYGGSAGVGMELLHHPEAKTVAADLARWTARVMPPTALPPALYFGRTGTALFLAAARLTAVPELPDIGPIVLEGEQRADQAHGVAGIGAGHLSLAALEQDPRHLEVAAECARLLVSGEVTDSKDAVAPAQAGSGVNVEMAFAHGAAGCAEFLLSYHEATGDHDAGQAARERFESLATATEIMLGELTGPDAKAMGASWCQGISGILGPLAHAAGSYGEDRYLDLAERGARASLAIAPQAWVVSQCCGLAGIGEALIDLAMATGDDSYWRGAEEVVELMLMRAGGEPSAPVFTGNDLDKPGYTWATGASGVLSFLRRLDRRTGSRLWTANWRLP
ncbi:class IV lanthionine synthetase LanL [Nonomuraea sp. CA-143628]|uniref:class IV lanthionine synthetase LanL n=1 Tax=Nonomuraea sp. CA-143628 TaxID=3239997 RepID=UPI003D8B482B